MGRRIKVRVLENIEIGEMVAEGKCIAKVEGMAVFVPRVAPGDVVDLRVVKQRKKYAEAEVITFHSRSPLRTEPFCTHFGTCGGCKWQHLPYDQQLVYKQKQVVDALERIGKVELPEIQTILPSNTTRYYRNKLEFTFSDSRWLTEEEVKSEGELDRRGVGFHVPRRFDRIVDLQECHLQAEPSNTIRLALREFAMRENLSFYNVFKHEGLLRNLIIRNATTGDLMVVVQFGENQPDQIQQVMEFLAERFPEITSLQYIINLKKNETFHDQEVVTYRGESFITEEMEGLKFRIDAKSFFQTNTEQALELYRVARNLAGLQGDEVVFDLYTGTGTIANFVAK
ncbi:MAG: 23S rRNA (uracil(1939)-C(5))-methyltransferase RlmD, partial [Bacteroidota bacterium]